MLDLINFHKDIIILCYDAGERESDIMTFFNLETAKDSTCNSTPPFQFDICSHGLSSSEQILMDFSQPTIL